MPFVFKLLTFVTSLTSAPHWPTAFPLNRCIQVAMHWFKICGRRFHRNGPERCCAAAAARPGALPATQHHRTLSGGGPGCCARSGAPPPAAMVTTRANCAKEGTPSGFWGIVRGHARTISGGGCGVNFRINNLLFRVPHRDATDRFDQFTRVTRAIQQQGLVVAILIAN